MGTGKAERGKGVQGWASDSFFACGELILLKVPAEGLLFSVDLAGGIVVGKLRGSWKLLRANDLTMSGAGVRIDRLRRGPCAASTDALAVGETPGFPAFCHRHDGPDF